ncbi:MAG: UDP-N-acetylmuramoyl-tripeptide--D-alanyl-D-alanine ligase [Cellvibrionaceae bacterium]
MIPLTFAGVENRLNARCVHGDVSITRVSTDTRTIQAGDIFVALRGDNFDGHNFVAKAVDAGAAGIVVDHEVDDITVPQLIVADTTKALGLIASAYRDQFTCPVVAITGSSGKTSVKEMLHSILSQEGEVLATRGNLNNHIGVPLTLFEMNDEHRFAVVEMGASGGGEIGYLCGLAKPDVAMVNNVMPAHLEGFGSVDGIAKAKGEIYNGLSSEGVAIFNLDEPFSSQWQEANKAKAITYGFGESATVHASDIKLSASGSEFKLTVACEMAPAALSVPGKHNIANALAASACACALGLNADEIAKGLANFSSVKGRLQQVRGLKGEVVIDDSYNANPGSVKAGIDVLATMPGKKVFIFGGMGELGDDAERLHREIGEYAAEKKIDELWVCGLNATDVADGFSLDDQYAELFTSRDDLIASYLASERDKDTAVLVKGSRSTRMDLVVAAIKSENNNDHGGVH